MAGAQTEAVEKCGADVPSAEEAKCTLVTSGRDARTTITPLLRRVATDLLQLLMDHEEAYIILPILLVNVGSEVSFYFVECKDRK
jgi:hypothetical protein